MKHIDSLRQYFPALQERERNTDYSVPVVLPSRAQIALSIHLSPNFPREPPSLTITPPCTHEFLDRNSNVVLAIHESLLEWNGYGKELLGQIVYETLSMLLKCPPKPIAKSSKKKKKPTVQTKKPIPTRQEEPPRNGNRYPELNDMSADALQNLLLSPDSLDALFVTLEATAMLDASSSVMHGQKEALERIAKTRRTLLAKQSLLQHKQNALEEKEMRRLRLAEAYSARALLEGLGKAAKEADCESEDIVQDFLRGRMDVKSFVDVFVEKRKVYHLRSAKRESLSRLR